MTEQYKYSPGPYSAGAYQISGRPYLTGGSISSGAEVEISFPAVTKAITIYNNGSNALRIHFASKTNARVINEKHYIDVPNSNTGGLNRIKLDVRCSKIYLSNASGGTTYQLVAECTLIPDALELSGSGIND